MRQFARKYAAVTGIGLGVLALFGAGPKSAPKKPETPLKLEETIADLAILRVNDSIQVEGVGLVTGLDNTGGEAEPSKERSKLLDVMRKARVENAEKLLANPHNSLVIVKAKIPVGITPTDRFDVDVELTPNSTTTSLAGGHLIVTRLAVMARAGGEMREGQSLAVAGGPVMIGDPAHPNDPRRGRILGGARIKKEIPYALALKEGRKSVKAAALIQTAINTRFHALKGIDQKGMADAKSDQLITLSVPQVYHNNQFRYFQVIEHLPVVDSPTIRTQRMAQWGKDLLDPKLAGLAALKLEGIGRNAIDTLKPGLASQNAQVRYFAAEALAYLGDGSGTDILAQAVIALPDYRPHALAALAATDDPSAILRLRELMSRPEPKVRYGAFNALRTLSEDDPYLGRMRVLREEPEEEEPDALAFQISPPARRHKAPAPDDPFELYVVDCEGPPLVHVARSRRNEIVLFGRGMKLLPPVVLGGKGPILLNAASSDNAIQISRIAARGPDDPDLKVTSSLVLGDVIREAANLGATYPEVLEILQASVRQKNLPGDVVVDALPEPAPAYDAAQLAGEPRAAKKDRGVDRTGYKARDGRDGFLHRLFRSRR